VAAAVPRRVDLDLRGAGRGRGVTRCCFGWGFEVVQIGEWGEEMVACSRALICLGKHRID
jgi:hypothetical protein